MRSFNDWSTKWKSLISVNYGGTIHMRPDGSYTVQPPNIFIRSLQVLLRPTPTLEQLARTAWAIREARAVEKSRPAEARFYALYPGIARRVASYRPAAKTPAMQAA